MTSAHAQRARELCCNMCSSTRCDWYERVMPLASCHLTRVKRNQYVPRLKHGHMENTTCSYKFMWVKTRFLCSIRNKWLGICKANLSILHAGASDSGCAQRGERLPSYSLNVTL